MANKKQCLISYAKNGREKYEDALDRCKAEASKHFDGDFIFMKDELPRDCDTHKETPYQFKPMIFREAFKRGYTQVIWMDSTIVMLRNPQRMFEVIARRGVLAFHNLGHPLAKWITDVALRNTGIDLAGNPQQIMACVVGFDISHKVGKSVFDEWLELSMDGESFLDGHGSHEGFINHRHDQACLSAILHRRKIKLLPYGNLIYEAHEETGFEGRTPYFLNKGI